MRPAKISLVDTFSHEKTTLTLPEKGLVCIAGRNRDEGWQGSNGSGKSSIIEAIYYSATDKTLRDSPLSEMVRHGAKTSLVDVCWTDGSDLVLDVHREYGANGKGKEVGATLRGTQQKLIQDHRSKTLQEQLEILFGWTPFVLRNAFFFTDDFRFCSKTEGQQLEIIHKLLPLLDVLEAAEQRLKDRAKLSRQSREVSSAVVRAESSVTEAMFVELREKTEDIHEQIQTLEADLAAARGRGNDHEREQKYIGRKRAEILKEIAQEKLGLGRSVRTRSLIRKEKSLYKTLVQHADRIEEWKALMQTHAKAGSFCDHCGTKVTKALAENYRDNLQGKINRETQLLETVEGEHQQADKAATEAVAAKKTRDTRKAKIRMLRVRLRGLKVAVNTPSNTDELEDRLKILRGRLEAPEDFSTGPETTALDKSLFQLYAHKNRYRALDAQSELFAAASELCGKSGIMSDMLEEVIPRLSASAEAFSREATDGHLVLKLLPTSRTKSAEKKSGFCMSVQYRGREWDLRSMSKGQINRLDLFMALAFNEVFPAFRGHQAPFLVLDDFFGKIDAEGDRKAIEILKRISANKLVICLGPASLFKRYADQTIQVELSQGISRIV